MPVTYITFLVATIAISGIPLTSGFLSKDGILAGTLAFGQLSGHWFIPIAGFGAAFLTAFYMFRLTIVSFHGKPKTDIANHTKENNAYITLPLVILAILTCWAFYSVNPFGAANGWFHKATQPPKSAVPSSMMWSFMNVEGTDGNHHGKCPEMSKGKCEMQGKDSKECKMDMAKCDMYGKDSMKCKMDMAKCKMQGKDSMNCKIDMAMCNMQGKDKNKGYCDEEKECKEEMSGGKSNVCKYANAVPFEVTQS